MREHTTSAIVLLIAIALGAGGCEKVNKENLDKWTRTEKGPGKIRKALEDQELSAELRARAARNLIRAEEWAFVKSVLDKTPDRLKQPLSDQLAKELWEDAKNFPNRMAEPLPRQVAAKDALYELRDYASEAGRKAIDGYLVEWLSGYYEGRSTKGRVLGARIVRTIGPSAAKGLMESANAVIAAPQNPDGSFVKMGDELLLGLAVSGSPEAVDFILDLLENEQKDETLHKRASGALNKAYADPPAGFEPAPAEALRPHASRIAALIKNPDVPGVIRNDSVHLVAAMGMPDCLPIFVDLVSFPADKVQIRWIGVQEGVRCGKHKSIVPLAEALPPGDPYERGFLDKYFWKEVLSLTPRAGTAVEAEKLLSSANWVARVSGVELLGMVGLKGRAAQDAEKIKAMAKDGTVLKGWWGKKDKQKRSDPTLGARAQEVAAALDKVAKK